MEEEGIKFKSSNSVFYNPNMHFCRSIFSLGVGAIGKKIKFVDGFAATGIRGIRYSKENKASGTYVDTNPSAVKLIKENLKKNKLKGKVIYNDFNKFIREEEFDLIEIDPFGTPVTHLYDAMRSFRKIKSAYLSVTATDVAVLCGPHSLACIKNYHAKSLNNEFTHETGVRMLLRRIAETAAEFNYGIEPLFSLSDQHYVKLFIKINKGEKYFSNSLKSFGYVSHCFKCGEREFGKRMRNKCICGAIMDYAGPLWLGELHDKTFLEKMIKLNSKRKYLHKEKLDKILNLMIGEISLPFYYNLHKLAKTRKNVSIPKINYLIEKLKEKGYKAERTHFSPQSLKTNAPISLLLKRH